MRRRNEGSEKDVVRGVSGKGKKRGKCELNADLDIVVLECYKWKGTTRLVTAREVERKPCAILRIIGIPPGRTLGAVVYQKLSVQIEGIKGIVLFNELTTNIETEQTWRNVGNTKRRIHVSAGLRPDVSEKITFARNGKADRTVRTSGTNREQLHGELREVRVTLVH